VRIVLCDADRRDLVTLLVYRCRGKVRHEFEKDRMRTAAAFSFSATAALTVATVTLASAAVTVITACDPHLSRSQRTDQPADLVAARVVQYRY
jgi:hypothetical protein